MATQVFRLSKPGEYRKAGPTDLIELHPAPGGHPLYVPKTVLEVIVGAIVDKEMVHLSGKSGAAKSGLLEALAFNAANFLALCEAMDLPPLPLLAFTIEMAPFEAPGELYFRRALKDGTTYDEDSALVRALTQAVAKSREAYTLVWLREMGRVHSASVQGGLLNLMTKGDILLPDGRRLPGEAVAWVADSNYQAEGSSTHTLVTLDDALKRRFTVNLTLEYLSPEQEAAVTEMLLGEWLRKVNHPRRIDAEIREMIANAVKLGQVARRHRAEGALTSIAPPTIYGYLAFMRRAIRSPHLGQAQIALVTLLGNAHADDRKLLPSVLNEVFGLQGDEEGEGEAVANLF